jgi:PAS domain S-box-containing protein
MTEAEQKIQRILTIDDEDGVRRSIRSYLEDSDYEVIEARDGREGIAVFFQERPDLVLCDLRMPDVDGLQVLASITAQSPETPILIVSGTGVIGDAIEAVRLGAWDYILKPIQDMSALELAIEKSLERSRLLRENRRYQVQLEEEVFKRTMVLEERTEQLRRANEELEQDIAARRRVESALNESEGRFRTVVECLNEGLVIADADNNVVWLNSRMAAMCGYVPDELIGGPVSIMGAAHVREALHNKTTERLLGIAETYETQLMRKGGEIFWVEISAGPFYGPEGQITGSLSVVRDISERKRAESEREKLESQLRRSQKLETIGTLAGGVAHDFNNILTPILGYGEMARFHLDAESPARGDLEQIIQAAHRARDLVRQILTFSRQGDQERRPVLIQLIVKEALKLIRASLPSTIEIREEIDSNCSPVLCEPTQIHQVLMNLCTNAYFAMRKKGGLLEVRQTTVDVDREFSCLHVNLKEGKYARLTVTDTGCGMDRSTLERAFEPFFTTKEAGEGTGLGLSVVHGIVTAHGGGISVYSEEGTGSSFNVYLPVTETEIEEREEDLRPPPGGNERILIVDDERVNALMAKQMLSSLGYDVMATTSSVEALEAFKDDPHRFDVVITDQTMPQVTGSELADAMLMIRPELPIILMTGFSETVTAQNYRQMGFRAYLMKPLIMRELARVIRSEVDGVSAPN